MSVRTDLVTALRTALPANVYRVVGSIDAPDQIDPEMFAVRAWASKLGPAPQSGASQVDVVVWVLSGKSTPGDVDDHLDVAYDAVLAALYELRWLTAPTAERGVMEDSDGPRWHGWRFDASAFATITLED
jgi:hypothetical protein